MEKTIYREYDDDVKEALFREYLEKQGPNTGNGSLGSLAWYTIHKRKFEQELVENEQEFKE